MSTVAIIQARSGSTRFPEKILKPLAGHSVLWHVIQRAKRSMIPNLKVIVATSTLKADDKVVREAEAAGALVFRGSRSNVLMRYYECAGQFNANPIIRITGDCPFIDPRLIRKLWDRFYEEGFDYLCIDAMESFPNGLDAEIFKKDLLDKMYERSKDRKGNWKLDREHVTTSIKHNNIIKRGRLIRTKPKYAPQMRLTLDYPKDYAVLQSVANALFPVNPFFGYRDIVVYMRKHPEICEVNANLTDLRDDGKRDIY